MIIKALRDEDFANYKEPTMLVGFPRCTFKCEKECGLKLCQNSDLATAPDISISCQSIVNRYITNPITSAIVFGGLEPFDSWLEMLDLIEEFRKHTPDVIIIYTGYNKEEILCKIDYLRLKHKNIIIKYGRFVPNQDPHYDEVLGIDLVSDNQYAEVIC